MNITLLLKKCGVSVRYPVSQFAEQQHKVKYAILQSHHIDNRVGRGDGKVDSCHSSRLGNPLERSSISKETSYCADCCRRPGITIKIVLTIIITIIIRAGTMLGSTDPTRSQLQTLTRWPGTAWSSTIPTSIAITIKHNNYYCYFCQIQLLLLFLSNRTTINYQVLNNYYVNPICTPSRSALLTGKHPIHTGINPAPFVSFCLSFSFLIGNLCLPITLSGFVFLMILKRRSFVFVCMTKVEQICHVLNMPQRQCKSTSNGHQLLCPLAASSIYIPNPVFSTIQFGTISLIQ